MVYKQENITEDKFRRIFKENADTEELVWHRDYEDREVFVESNDGWMLQMDNEVPQMLQEGQKYFIPKGTYHRVIKGTGDLKIVIDEGINKVKVPKSVKRNIKKGLRYLKLEGKSSHKFEQISNQDKVDISVIIEFRDFFHSHSKNITLNESFKGIPQKDKKYVDWLLRGGDYGYDWVIHETIKRV